MPTARCLLPESTACRNNGRMCVMCMHARGSASSPDGGFDPFNIQIIEVSRGQIVGLHHFLSPELFAVFGLPDHLDD